MRRTDPDVYKVPFTGDLPADVETVIAALSPCVTERRLERMTTVAQQRHLDCAVVVERLIDPHNVSAILRSADAFGVQNVHVIPAKHGFNAAHAVSRGSHRWLSLSEHETPEACAAALKADGFQIYVASMEGELTPEDLAKKERVALVFGNEHFGPSETIRGFADGTLRVPMRGFVESLNVSVAAAISLYTLTRGRPEPKSASDAQASTRDLIARFLMSTVRDAERIVLDSLTDR